MERPRILEVPDVAPPPPALGGITIEPLQVEEPEKRPGIDMPLQCAPLGLRIVAALTDFLIIGVAAAVFGCIFWKVAGVRPPRLQLLGTSLGILFVFWTAYQYLLLVYSARTPGLLLAHLELAHFDAGPPDAHSGVGASWLPSSPLFLWVWGTYGCFSTRIPSAGMTGLHAHTSLLASWPRRIAPKPNRREGLQASVCRFGYAGHKIFC